MIKLHLLVFVLLCFTVSPDTIELKTGERIEGAFKEAGSGRVVMEVAGQPVIIPIEKVRAIYLGATPERQPPASSLVTEVMDALRGLRSVTTSGISYRDYSQRVIGYQSQI